MYVKNLVNYTNLLTHDDYGFAITDCGVSPSNGSLWVRDARVETVKASAH